MPDTLLAPVPADLDRLGGAARRMAASLADALRVVGSDGDDLAAVLADFGAGAGWRAADGSCLDLPAGRPEPIDRLVAAVRTAPAETDLLVLAALPQEHEAMAEVFRRLHPARQPHATTGLAALVAHAGGVAGLGSDASARAALQRLLLGGAGVRSGALDVDRDGPFWERSLTLAPGLADVLRGGDRWPAFVRPVATAVVLDGLAPWFEDDAVDVARRAIATGRSAVIGLYGRRADALVARAVALVAAAGREAVALDAGTPSPEDLATIAVHAGARGLVPVVGLAAVPLGIDVSGPLLLCLPDDTAPSAAVDLTLPIRPLPRATRAALWDAVSTDGVPCPPDLEPIDALAYASDPGRLQLVVSRPEELSACPGTVLIRPRAGWDDLVLPSNHMEQLREAVARVDHRDRVLGAWGVLAGRPGRQGLRMLFCGPPGTGKTLAAEVIAHAVGRDLLIADLSRMVSKWIGETEKNLSAAFDAAEAGDVVLLFDEADALFGRRTEVGDARDRYANLETAYLLSRLERFDGIAILATNLRQNIDVAFGRRLEFIVPFDPPTIEQRTAIWQAHLRWRAPVADDVSPRRLAALYTVPGGAIRNAAVAAAFLAAADGGVVTLDHIQHALEREYAKAGHAFPGRLPNLDGEEPKEQP